MKCHSLQDHIWKLLDRQQGCFDFNHATFMIDVSRALFRTEDIDTLIAWRDRLHAFANGPDGDEEPQRIKRSIKARIEKIYLGSDWEDSWWMLEVAQKLAKEDDPDTLRSWRNRVKVLERKYDKRPRVREMRSAIYRVEM